MHGSEFLNLLIGTSTVDGLLDKNPDDTGYRALMLKCLNLVRNDISTRQQNWHWKWLEKTVTTVTVADQMDYDLPTDIDTTKVFSVFDRTYDRSYKFVPHDILIKIAPDPSTVTGNPYLYSIWAGVLKLYPIPDSVFTVFLKYVKNITSFTDAAVSIEIPEKYDNVVIDGALKWAYKFDPELGDEAKQTQLYENGISLMMMDNRLVIDGEPVSGSHRDRYNGYLQEFPVNQ